MEKIDIKKINKAEKAEPASLAEMGEKTGKEDIALVKKAFEAKQKRIVEVKKALKVDLADFINKKSLKQEEKKEIFKSIPEHLLKEFSIVDFEEMMIISELLTIPEQMVLYKKCKVIIKEKPEDLFKEVDKFKNAGWAFNILVQALIKNPQKSSEQAFENIKLYNDKPWANKILQLALPFAPTAAIKNIKDYKDLQDAEQIFKFAVYLNPSDAIDYIEDYKTLPYAKGIFLSAIQKAPEKAFSMFDAYSDMDWAENIIFFALNAKLRKPEAFLQNLYQYENEEWISKALKQFINRFPDLILQNCIKYQKILSANFSDDAFVEMLKKYFTENTDDAFELIKYYKNQTWAFKLLSIAAEKNPEEAMKYYKEYRNSSWAQEFGMKILKSKTPNELSFLFHNAALLTPQDLMSFLKILERNPDSVLFIDGSIIYNSAYLALIKEKISTIEDKDVKQKLNDNLEKQLLKIEQFSQNILNPQTQKATPTKGMSEMKKILWNDPALKFALRIENGWLMPKPANEQTMDKFKLLIARDLYMQKKPLTMFNTQDSYQKLLRQKASMGEMMIFGGRNVVFATNNAFNENNDLSDMIKKEGGELSLYKTDVKDETIMKSVKQKLLTSISDTVPPLTFIFSRSERNSGFKFSSTEFSTALNARHQKYPDEMPPILIFDNDQRFAFIKEVYSRLTYKENLPICISAAEFKQYSGSADLIYDVMGSGKEKFTSLADSVYLNKQRKKKKT